MREDLLNQAVSFLIDAKVKSSHLSKRISFLEGKGLTTEEIEEALKRAYPQERSPSDKEDNNDAAEGRDANFHPKEETLKKQPQLPERIAPSKKRPSSTPWTDIFVWGMLASGASLVLATYAKNLFKNWIVGWPFFKSESDKLLQEINELKKSIDAIKTEQQALKEKVVDQCDDVKRLIDESKAKIETWSNSEFETRTQMDGLVESIERINRLLPQVQNSATEQLRESIKEWEIQLVSLRALICAKSDEILVPSPMTAREPSSSVSPVVMPLPAWQSDPSLGAINELVL